VTRFLRGVHPLSIPVVALYHPHPALTPPRFLREPISSRPHPSSAPERADSSPLPKWGEGVREGVTMTIEPFSCRYLCVFSSRFLLSNPSPHLGRGEESILSGIEEG